MILSSLYFFYIFAWKSFEVYSWILFFFLFLVLEPALDLDCFWIFFACAGDAGAALADVLSTPALLKPEAI
jgi:hypothetical protein